MNAAEALTLCRMVKAVCPSQAIDEYTPDAWAALLADVPFAEARDAVVAIGKLPLEPGKARYIEPGHIRWHVTKARNEAAQRRVDEPPPGLTVPEYLEWLRHPERRQPVTEELRARDMRQITTHTPLRESNHGR